MITLYGFGAGFGLPEISPFVTKTEVQLKMAGLAYRKEKAIPPASPKGQLPYIVDEAESIADSTFIRAHIEGKYGFDFDAPLSSLFGVSPRLADSAAPAAFCCAFDFAGIVAPPSLPRAQRAGRRKVRGPGEDMSRAVAFGAARNR